MSAGFAATHNVDNTTTGVIKDTLTGALLVLQLYLMKEVTKATTILT
ncbi:hypothetical protein ALNOE001_16290 [Candidatus Methanobinarius endosymbioticus]|uniref:Uncharacterized protein n=1 Tax=Candidatus Methanobinarius endosymbioticus TaxID=2006182 RepID=A0A366MAY8_9EURY|nr:hypothetical protein ALNOE001_16290 [Candidatus Methanobinarius endosymbioticus]